MENSRRKFLKKAVIGSAAITALPITVNALQKPQAVISCNPLTLDYYGTGPFYTANAPMLSNIQLANANEPGDRIIVSGRVKTLDCSKVISEAIIDVWHANDAGQYDNSGYNLRGKLKSNAQGFYQFETVLPGKYLNGSQYRPRHIHFKITAPNFPEVTTQLYFVGDTSIANDAAASITSGKYDARDRIIPITKNDSGVYEGTWDIIIDGNGINENDDIKTDNGILYHLTPNPFDSALNIKYGVFNEANVSLIAYDMSGKQVEVIVNEKQKADVYEITWEPSTDLTSGTYWLAMKVNDLQVHYQKFLKQ